MTNLLRFKARLNITHSKSSMCLQKVYKKSTIEKMKIILISSKGRITEGMTAFVKHAPPLSLIL